MDSQLLRILTADIEPTAKLLATALYAYAPVSGSLPQSDVLAIVGLRTTGALRHLRSQLAAAQLLSSSLSAGELSWQFLSGASLPRVGVAHGPAPRPTDAQDDPERVPQTRTAADSASLPRAGVAHGPAPRPTDAQDDPERVPQTRTAADSASLPRVGVANGLAPRPTDALTNSVTPVTPSSPRPTDAPPPPHTPPGRQVGSLINLNQEENLPTPLPPTAEEQARSVKLLRAISVNARLAAQIAARWGFRDVCAFVAVYLADHAAGKCNGAGVLQARCLEPDSAAPHLAADAPELAGVLLRQHITPADRSAWRAADEDNYRAAEYEFYAAAAPKYQDANADREPEPDRDPAAKMAAKLAAFTKDLCTRYRLELESVTVERRSTADVPEAFLVLTVPAAADRARLADHHLAVGNLAMRHVGVRTYQIQARAADDHHLLHRDPDPGR